MPSLSINSGNGFGLFWELAEPVTVTAENLEDIKARNVALVDQLGGDDCGVAMTGPTRAGDKSTTPRYGVTLLRWGTEFVGEHELVEKDLSQR